MASNCKRKIGNTNSSSLSTRIIGSRNRLSEATHILLRELSTQKPVIIEINSLSYAARMKPLTPGRNVSFRDGDGRGQKQGEILITGRLFSLKLYFSLYCSFFAFLLGTYDEVTAEMSNQTFTNLTNNPQKRQRLDDRSEQTSNEQHELSFISSISSNLVDTSFNQSSCSQEFALLSPSPTSSTLGKTKTTTSSLLSSENSTTVIDETSKECNITGVDSLITTHQSIPLPSGSPLPSASASPSSMTTNSKTSRNSPASRILVASTTIKRKTVASDTLKELKRLQQLVESKDNEISKLTEQVKKLKEELEQVAQYSICT
jgi:hypothetical protein